MTASSRGRRGRDLHGSHVESATRTWLYQQSSTPALRHEHVAAITPLRGPESVGECTVGGCCRCPVEHGEHDVVEPIDPLQCGGERLRDDAGVVAEHAA